LARRN